MIVDSHCHLIHEKNLISVEEIIHNASKNNVSSFLNIATKYEEFDKSIELSEKYKCIYTSIGIHPHEAYQMNDDIYNKIIDFSNHEKVIGIGETGLDYFYNNSLKEDQIKSFESHIKLSQKTNLPVIIHSRDAEDDILNIIKKMNDKKPFSAVFHCFTGSTQLLEKLLPFNIYFSISGIVTFKNSNNLRQTVKEIPLNKVLLETDSPYLSPVPMRGKINQPAHIIHTLEYLADLFNLNSNDLTNITTSNFYNLFKKAKSK
tara:strand:+ start:832 stop:1611 length:780 start_codon:yes stop_codon:yes gene_type:complete